ncbi:MAG TPA: hypothetical protein DCR55_02625 [Lentisphaeria bacterium]|nr:hypothetical protein [Lentisphaeria bacterium]
MGIHHPFRIAVVALTVSWSALAVGPDTWWAFAPAAAQEANQQARGLGRDVADIPEAAMPLLRLPAGLVKVVFGPFTKRGTQSGMRDVNAAVKAPFDTLKQIVDVPVNMVRRF